METKGYYAQTNDCLETSLGKWDSVIGELKTMAFIFQIAHMCNRIFISP